MWQPCSDLESALVLGRSKASALRVPSFLGPKESCTTVPSPSSNWSFPVSYRQEGFQPLFHDQLGFASPRSLEEAVDCCFGHGALRLCLVSEERPGKYMDFACVSLPPPAHLPPRGLSLGTCPAPVSFIITPWKLLANTSPFMILGSHVVHGDMLVQTQALRCCEHLQWFFPA